MTNLQLKIVHRNNNACPPRLCECCAFGLVLRGEGTDFTWCGYMRDYVSVRVESCSRFTARADRRGEESALRLLTQYTLE